MENVMSIPIEINWTFIDYTFISFKMSLSCGNIIWWVNRISTYNVHACMCVCERDGVAFKMTMTFQNVERERESFS